MQQPAVAEQQVVGCGFGAQLLAHEPDLEKDEGCFECGHKPDTRRTWRQWARRNDCCFAKDNCAGAVLCAPWTGIKWIMVGLFAMPLFWTHFGMGLARFFSGGAFHMVCKALCDNKGSTSLTVVYYVVGGVPLMINYLLAICEMLVVFVWLQSAFFATFAASALNILCAVEAWIELVRISDDIYNLIFANLPIALEHPGKLVAPCWFGTAYRADRLVGFAEQVPGSASRFATPAQQAQQINQLMSAQPAPSGLQMQPAVPAAVQPDCWVTGGPAQPASPQPSQPAHVAASCYPHVPVVQGCAVGIPVSATASSSQGAAGPSSPPKGTKGEPPPYGAQVC